VQTLASALGTTLNEILQDLDLADLIRIDVEEAEYEVLLGAKESLSKVKCMTIEPSHDAREVLKLSV